MIAAEANHYAGQTHPCWGAHVSIYGTITRFLPWVFDGRVVWWLSACSTKSEALAMAQQHAAQVEAAR